MSEQILRKLLRRSLVRVCLESGLLLIAIVLMYAGSLQVVAEQYHALSGMFTFSALLYFVAFKGQQQWRKISLVNITEHLNRHFSELEESGQLLLEPPSKLSVLQRLQRKKVGQILAELREQGRLNKCLPALRYKASILLMVIGIFTLMVVISFPCLDPCEPPVLLATSVTVTPPAYTALPQSQLTKGDIEIIEGSTVQWQLTMSQSTGQYSLLFGDESPLKLLRQPSSNDYVTTKTITKTGLYRITDLPGVYSVSVIKDKKPKVRVVEPNRSLLELPKSSEAKFTAKALVSDDFGLTKVEILASVAKGSGESVKFRDEVFEFDSHSTTKQGELYTKTWDLKALGMEPGDEVYFTVVAYDNKMGEAQQGRSGTVIVRWLDDEEQGIAAEGILIDYVAEYFRSQRQIIIETEQLLADKDDLTTEQFSQTSTSLGYSQSDLKQRYGQYLGDEFGDESSGQLDAGDVLEADHEEEHEHEDPQAHATTEGIGEGFGSASAVIAQFAHAHEAVHVGEVSSQNPKAMMKKAVSIMWQAEAHLLQSEPELALPFEKQAYKYLKLAKQAERIYVKRLGFEPPPVSEDKRLTGELTDIHSYSHDTQTQQNSDSDDALFRQSFTALNQVQDKFGAEQRLQLDKLKTRLTELAETRPGLIRQAATVERILLGNSIVLTDCEQCLVKLKQKLWQLVSSPVSHPVAGQQNYLNADAVIGDYLQRVQR
ncbi:MAG: hypothetical protein HRT35_03430 [Algicola sp.]|nr:hypothetical protein [Algicola sp.]